MSSIHDQPSIDCLPDEILGAVFFLNTDIKDDSHDTYKTAKATILVCKRWYNIVFDYPTLWGRIINYQRDSPDKIQELLRRTKTSLIDVGADSMVNHVRMRDSRGKTVLGHIFDHGSKIRSLNLQITFSPWSFICKRFLQNPAPNLEYLKLDTSCPFPDCLFPDPLFADQAPKLRKIHLQRCLINFSSSSVMCNLTALTVMDILAPSVIMMNRAPDHPLKVAPTVEGWLRILESIPSLQYLTLSNSITPQKTDIDPLSKIRLPNLVFLTIGGKFQEGTALLEHLSLPPCGIRLRLSYDRSNPGNEDTKLLYFLSSSLSSWSQDSHGRYLQAKILSGNRVHFGNSRRVGHVWDMTESEVIEEHKLNSVDPLLWLVLSFDNTEDSLQFFDRLLTLYETTYATTTSLDLWIDEEFTNAAAIHVNGFPVLPSLSILRAFSSVKVLDLLERSPLTFLPLLEALSSDSEIPFFPALRSLRLTRTDVDYEPRASAVISGFLNWRKTINVPLTDLDIVGGKICDSTSRFFEEAGNVKVTKSALGAKWEDSESDKDSDI